jgi:hypothetical protein
MIYRILGREDYEAKIGNTKSQIRNPGRNA